MRIKIYGTRGSYPVCNLKVNRYGGNTTCFFIQEDKEQIIIDGGSGIANLGNEIVKCPLLYNKKINILLTHTHWDHVMGFPFFYPFYYDKYKINIYGADSETMMIKDVLVRQQSDDNFPIPFEALKANINFNTLMSGKELTFNNIKVKTYQLNHPGYDLGYRFESESGVFIVLTDLAEINNNYLGMGMKEKAENKQNAFEKDYYNGLVEFIKDADIVLHETNFTTDEIKGKKHWGHSCPAEALKLLSHYNSPPALILSHHDPFHTDEDMDEIYFDTKDKGKKMGIEVFIAKEGGEFIL